MVSLNPVQAQYAPAAGKPGSTAISKDSSCFVEWASGITIRRGRVNISDTSSALASFGENSDALGPADIQPVSLGDSGEATLTFDHYIEDGPGWDFAIFENSFADDYLEFGLVEVSSDGKYFVRFPARSLIQDTVQTDGFGYSDPEKVNNLAGKYRGGYGTPFDLSVLKNIPGLDISRISHIKVRDAVGSISRRYGAADSIGHLINDPYPTPYPSAGFDLDAIGVIHSSKSVGIAEEASHLKGAIRLYPNPVDQNQVLHIELPDKGHSYRIKIYSLSGVLVYENLVSVGGLMLNLQQGMYIAEIQGDISEKLFRSKLYVR